MSTYAPVDSLEARAMLAAASVSFNADNGKLTIVGTAESDNFVVALFHKSEAVVTDNGKNVLTFSLKHAKSVSFDGGAGDDSLVMGRVPMRVWASGGDGKDALSASEVGNFSDTLAGGANSDYLYGGPGNDFLDGGDGDDGMVGGPGKDYFKVVSDDLGDDTVSGGAGIDTADFSDYNRGVTVRLGDASPPVLGVDDFILNDVEIAKGTGYSDTFINTSSRPVTVFLGRGYDHFVGSRAPETIYGQRGDDRIEGNGGNDVIYDTIGTNAIDGGSGTDTAFVNGETAGSTVTGVESIDPAVAV